MGIWLPTTEAEIEQGIASGNLPEGHFLDFKRELGTGHGARKETAQDIASFALDGGVLVVGVAEPSPGKYEMSPQPVTDLSERAEQIAANKPDPGLYVRTTIVPSNRSAGMGYLVIEIPPSPAAPHMVDGRYWGRSERIKRHLNDAEVARLHAGRASVDRRVMDALEEEIRRDPSPRPSSRMFLVAEPLVADPGLAREFIRRSTAATRDLLQGAEDRVPASVRDWAPRPWDLHSTVRRAGGVALTNLAEGRQAPADVSYQDETDIEVQIPGSVRAFVSGTTHHEDHPRLPAGVTYIHEGLVLAWSHRVVAWARTLGDLLGYRGPWGFGVHIYGLAGVRRSAQTRDGFRVSSFDSWPVYDAPLFERTAVANYQEIQDDPAAVVDRLAGDLIHALGASRWYPDALPTPDVGTPGE